MPTELSGRDRDRAPALQISALACAGLLACATGAQAHVSLEPSTAAVGKTVQLHVVVGHGCSGHPTTALRVRIPAGVRVLSVAAKAGWTTTTEKAGQGQITSITWRGALGAHERGVFDFEVQPPASAGMLQFASAQSCGDIVVDWDRPAAEGSAKGARPAPVLEVVE